MAKAAGWVREALERLFPGDEMLRLDDPTAARIEGFDPVREAREAELIVEEGAGRFVVALGGGHKTGLYLDQRENRGLVAGLARGRRVLDAFCYTGGFAVQALLAGADSALLLDSSADALATARRNLALNGLEARAEASLGNAFDGLRELEARGERFGLVVLDPPPFTRRKDALEAAARGYKEINLRGLRLLAPGGLLATFSCSHHVTPALFEDICRQAAGDAGIRARVLATLTQSRDHPVLLTVPETRYLTGLLLEVC
jgi:23S rRNA (cytosine1962-C5)-methyltransferase